MLALVYLPFWSPEVGRSVYHRIEETLLLACKGE